MKKVLGLLFLLYISDAMADVVDKIEFEGLDRVEAEAIQDCVTVKPGKNYTQSDLDAMLKALFKKDFFSYIRFIKRSNTLVIKCEEKPMIDKVAFEGNDIANDDMLKTIINGRIGEGRLVSLCTIRDVLSDLQVAYRALGCCSATITPKIIKHPGNKIDIVFEINEGSKTKVKKILLVGNKSFSDDELKDLLLTKEEKIWRFWDYDSHVFREDRVDVDIETLTSFYKNNGYPFFMITSTSAEIDFDKKSHYCTFCMEEGDKYTIKNVTLESKVDKIKANDFKEFITIGSKSVYNESLINAIRDNVRSRIALKDNPFIDVIVNIDYDKIHKTANVRYSIIQRPKAFIERIEIVGNTRTLDRVIRREFTVHDGDALNVYKIQKTVEHLRNMEYFDDVQISDSPGSAEDKKVLVVAVKEKESTAHVRFGLNVSDADGFGGLLGVVENNMMGTGNSVSADIFWMQKYYGCKVSVFNPRFMDKNFGAGLALGFHRYNRKNVDQSITKSAYVSPFVSYKIREDLTHRISYTVSINDRRWWSKSENKLYEKVPDNVQESTYLMKDEYGKYVCGELSSTLFYNKTDNSYYPRGGYDVSLTNSYAGAGGGVRYLKNELSGNYYYPLTQKLTFITSANVGHIHEIKNTRSAHRYALGGDGESMRGFDSYGVGPRDMAENNNSIGGNKYWTLSFMVKAPLSTREVGINGVVFVDFGSAWGTKYSKALVKDSSSIRASIGIAIEWAKSPLGTPLSFVFGFPLKKKKFDEKQTFTLTGLM
ncbi:MAG: outer membrane protein assembly factor BamA [Holosporaceae bacterium]|jgi:outer membrane protein insertion porin family|nr:outer membrane protein assembly factor BamA [Holosporaceae bacterium]